MARALYFYVDVTTPKCFFEELPKDTLVVGHYTAEEWDDHLQAWAKHDGISIYISVDVRLYPRPHTPANSMLTLYREQEIFDNDHRVVSQRGGASGKFTFTAADPGDHKLCFTPSSNSGRSNWLSVSAPNGGIRLTLDVAIGETSAIEGGDKDKMQDLATRVRDLNARLNDIRREQVFQRVSPHNHSPLTNP
jgi:hypothetical protein